MDSTTEEGKRWRKEGRTWEREIREGKDVYAKTFKEGESKVKEGRKENR